MLDGGVCLAIEISTASQPLSLAFKKPIPCLISGRRWSSRRPDYCLTNLVNSVYYNSRLQHHEILDMSSGGYRPGSGRPGVDINALTSTEHMPEPRTNTEYERKSPLEYLVDLYNGVTIDPQRRDRAAIAALPFVHRHMARMTKAEEKQDLLDAVRDDRFLPPVVPKRQVLDD